MKKNRIVPKNTFFRVMLLQFQSTPLLNVIVILLGVGLGLSLAFNAMAMQNLFDITSETAKNRGSVWSCFPPLLILAGTTMGVELLQGVFDFLADAIFKKSAGKLKLLLFKKVQQVDPIQFENPAFLDNLNQAYEGVTILPYICMSACICVSFYLVYFLTVGSYLFALKPILLVSLFLSFVPALLGQVVRLHVYWRLEEQNAPIRRKCDYYQRTMCDREYYKETRLLGAFEYFYSLFEQTLNDFSKKQWQTEKKVSLIQWSLDCISFMGMGISTLILVSATMKAEISIGAFAAVFTALRALFSMMDQLVCGHIANINQNFGKVGNLMRLMDMPILSGADQSTDMSKGIVLENVSFYYFGKDVPAVSNVSLTFSATETVALVGENGAGKSTLVRLLTGIYKPTEGRVLIGGRDTLHTKPEQLYRRISGVFQKINKYKLTLKENVALSALEQTDGLKNETNIRKALDEAGFHPANMPLDIVLSPEYGGVDLSGGQWQRLAIARGLYRDNDCIVLDEPTAAIDPLEETKIYWQFKKMSEGKCSIIVTHRLGSARLADRIVVMDKGKVVDVGTHEELLARPGKYADMYTAQSKWYVQKSSDQTSFPVDDENKRGLCLVNEKC